MIGVGNMSGAILARLLQSDAAPDQPVRITTRSDASANRYRDNPGISVESLEENPAANREACRGANVIVLGVKPQQLNELLTEIAPEIAPGTIVISVAAGVETATFESMLPEGVRVVRAMPNTPSTVGLGVTGIAGGASADEEALAAARTLFAAVGEVVEVPERDIPAIGAIAGSGPGHVYLLLETMIDATMRYGFDRQTATDMVVQTFDGAIQLAKGEPETDIETHRRRVMSPQGTTEQSIAVLESADLASLFQRAFNANVRRSGELAAAFAAAQQAEPKVDQP